MKCNALIHNLATAAVAIALCGIGLVSCYKDAPIPVEEKPVIPPAPPVSAPVYKIMGQVTDQFGKALVGVKVSCPVLNVEKTSDEQAGAFSIDVTGDLNPNGYAVTFELDGYDKIIKFVSIQPIETGTSIVPLYVTMYATPKVEVVAPVKYYVVGTVTDYTTKEPIVGAKISVGNNVVTTRSNGQYLLLVVEGDPSVYGYTVQAGKPDNSAKLYIPQKQNVFISSVSGVDSHLSTINFELDIVVVEKPADAPANNTITPEEIERELARKLQAEKEAELIKQGIAAEEARKQAEKLAQEEAKKEAEKVVEAATQAAAEQVQAVVDDTKEEVKQAKEESIKQVQSDLGLSKEAKVEVTPPTTKAMDKKTGAIPVEASVKFEQPASTPTKENVLAAGSEEKVVSMNLPAPKNFSTNEKSIQAEEYNEKLNSFDLSLKASTRADGDISPSLLAKFKLAVASELNAFEGMDFYGSMQPYECTIPVGYMLVRVDITSNIVIKTHQYIIQDDDNKKYLVKGETTSFTQTIYTPVFAKDPNYKPTHNGGGAKAN